MDDILMHTDESWNRETLSMNRHINLEVIHTPMPNAVGDWDWSMISERVDIHDVLMHPNEPWSKMFLTYNERLPVSVLMRIWPMLP
jgi:hypothetical protein